MNTWENKRASQKSPRVRYEELGEVGRNVPRESGAAEDSRITHK